MMTATNAAGGPAPAADGPRVKSPVQIQIPNTEERSSMLKSFTVYIINVSDFGRSYQVERRFDDFAKLHAELADIDPNLPPIPEKKMWASTDAQTVAERRPAFEKILRHMLRSEDVVFEKTQTLWKFLEMPAPGIVAACYMFKAQRLKWARQCGKLLDPKYEKEHAYRLAHESMIKTNLHLLTTELPQLEGKAESKADFRPPERTGSAGSEAARDSAAGDADLEASSVPVPAQEAECAALEMLRWALTNGGEAARRAFLEERGMSAMLNLLFRKGRESSSADAVPDARVKSVLNALIKAEGDRFYKVFADFLASGGVSILNGVKDLFTRSQGFSEFISKLLWIAWDQETQKAFLQDGREALGLLSALFECPSRTARTCAGLLLSCLLANRLLEGKEAQAAAGVYRLLEDLAACSPAWTRKQVGGDGGAAAAAPLDKEETDFAAFIQTLGQSEERFARILGCADAPWRLHGGTLPDEQSPLWACAAFALWCLLKLWPPPARVASLRASLPAVVQAAPSQVRWLAAELLLMLQLQNPTHLGGQIPGTDGLIEATFQERAALEVALREQVEHNRQSLRVQLEEHHQVLQSQHGLTEERQRPLALAQQAAWHRPLDEVLRRLGAVREKLTGSLDVAESRREGALTAVQQVLKLDLRGGDGDEASNKELEVKLNGMREVECTYLAKKEELAGHQAELKRQDALVEAANTAMEKADKAVQDTRKRIIELETQITTKHREAHSKRTMASSDFSALKGKNMAEMDQIKQKQARIRERAVKIQAGEPLKDGGVPLDASAAQEEMTRLKQESAQLKARNAELTLEQQKMEVDPATLEQQAREAEEAVVRISGERDALRAGLQDLEVEHAQARDLWQAAMKNLQAARQNKEFAERECSGLKQQLDTVWASWQPLWARRLEAWGSRVRTLAQAQQGFRQLVEAVGQSWESLRAERALRKEVMSAVLDLQGQLASLTRELQAVDDQALEAVLEGR